MTLIRLHTFATNAAALARQWRSLQMPPNGLARSAASWKGISAEGWSQPP